MSSSDPLPHLNQLPPAGLSSAEAKMLAWRNRRLQVIPTLLLLLVVVLALALANTPADSRGMLSDISLFLSMFFSFCCTLWAMSQTPTGRARLAWGLLALGQFLYVVGDAGDIILTAQGVSATVLTLPDLFQLPFVPLMVAGILLFPAAESTTSRQVRVIIDVGIIVGAVFGAAWVFLISPRGVGDSLEEFIFTLVPVADSILLLVLFALLVRGVEVAYRAVLISLLIGTVCFLYADTAYNYLSLPELHVGPNYTAGLPYVDVFWVAGAFAFSLAGLALLRQWDNVLPDWGRFGQFFAQSHQSLPRGLLSRFLVTALPVLLLFALLVLITIDRTLENADITLLFVTGIVMLLIIIRQLLTMSDLVDARIATARAEQLDSLKDQFITSVNHELRTPLMTMKGYLTLLTDTRVQAPAEKRLDMLTRANRSCESLVYLVQGILDTRRIDQEASNFTPEAISTQEAMQAALRLIDPHEADPTERQIAVDIPDDLVIWGESVRLQQIFTNLVSNAIKYSPAGTPIFIRAHRVVERTGRLLGGKHSVQPMVEIIVQDQGLGIPPEQKDLLFRRFVRLPRDIASTVRGTGLGLYLCRVFSEAMGGSIWVESTGEPGEGSTFHVRLPVPPRSTTTMPSLEAIGTLN